MCGKMGLWVGRMPKVDIWPIGWKAFDSCRLHTDRDMSEEQHQNPEELVIMVTVIVILIIIHKK